MARGRLNPRRAKIHRSYSVAEVAVLFTAHRNTVRSWIKRGLPVVRTSNGLLILGKDLRPFLEQRRAARRRKCGPGTLYCLRCREPRRPRRESVAVLRATTTTANIAAQCEVCGARMHRRASLERLAATGFGALPLQAGGLAPIR
jgi:hypothetical protein